MDRESFDQWWKDLEPDVRAQFMENYTLGLEGSVKAHSGEVRKILRKYFTGDQDPPLNN